MGSSFRYHLSTLIAIFLALGVGMVIGFSYLQGPLADHLSQQLKDLSTSFKREVEPLRTQKQQYVDWVTAVRPTLLKGRLVSRRVAIVQTGDYSSLTPMVRDALSDAGATVSSTTAISKVFTERADRQLTTILSKLRDLHPELDLERDSIIRILARSIAKGVAGTDLDVLTSAKLIETDGDYSLPAHSVVIVGGARDDTASARVEAIDRPLVEQLRAMGVHVVLVEPSDAVVSYVPLLEEQDLPTVDNAETDIGQISTVLAFASPANDYGIKQTARGGILPRPAAP